MLYGVIKGLPKAKLRGAALDMLQGVQLANKTHVKARALSGGMKRKLSVAIALLGSPKLVVLDEPTSGMDVYARRSTWKLIRKAKVGQATRHTPHHMDGWTCLPFLEPSPRWPTCLSPSSSCVQATCAVVLTTHYMGEADLLGDRIVIMAQGRIKVAHACLWGTRIRSCASIIAPVTHLHVFIVHVCWPATALWLGCMTAQAAGTSLFLKARFGVGYSLSLVRGDVTTASEADNASQTGAMTIPAFRPDALTAFVRRFVPLAKYGAVGDGEGEADKGGDGASAIFTLPWDSVHLFPPLLRELETNS